MQPSMFSIRGIRFQCRYDINAFLEGPFYQQVIEANCVFLEKSQAVTPT